MAPLTGKRCPIASKVRISYNYRIMGQPPLFGFLAIDKPPRKTSRDVVNVVQRMVRPAKAGHAGTLDPLATGVLVVCVGPATRLVSLVQESRKQYRATFRFGVTSETDDLEGDVVLVSDAPRLTQENIAAVLPEFVGIIDQIPPRHSAVHVNGRRAYQLARQGQNPELSPRKVSVQRIEIENFNETAQILTCEIECGSGTYIRSLGRDIAARLGTGCVMTDLRRLAVGEFSISSAIPLHELTAETLVSALQPARLAFDHDAEWIELTIAEWEEIRHGRFISRGKLISDTSQRRLPLMYQNKLAALGRYDPDRQAIRPEMVFPLAPAESMHDLQRRDNEPSPAGN